MKFTVKLKVFGRVYDLVWLDGSPDKVTGPEVMLAWLKEQAGIYRMRRISVGPIPAYLPPEDWNDPYSFLGFCEYYNQEENPGTELEVIGEIPSLGDAPDDAVY